MAIKAIKPQNFNTLQQQYTDPESRAMIQQAELAAKQGSQNALEDINARGLLNSTIATDRATQIQQEAVTGVLPQLMASQEARKQREIDNAWQRVQMLGYVDNAASKALGLKVGTPSFQARQAAISAARSRTSNSVGARSSQQGYDPDEVTSAYINMVINSRRDKDDAVAQFYRDMPYLSKITSQKAIRNLQTTIEKLDDDWKGSNKNINSPLQTFWSPFNVEWEYRQ